ncbi:MAG: putative DNA-binding domain-containing protein [Bacteroidetes bacterium]|nr:putative DNA-binding domain-containing protein [Bacteroidota bacterium]
MNNLLHSDTHTQQSSLAHYCRTGELLPIKGLTENRVHHYRRLVYNVIDDTLQSAFPLTFNLLSEEKWNGLVNIFFSSHECKSTSIWQMPFEFYQFVERSELVLKNKYVFLEELLLFEWTEIEVYMMEDKTFPAARINGDWLNDSISFNPEFKLLQLNYPVHFKNPNEITENEKREYYVLIFREPDTGKVQFIDLSFFFAWLIEKLNCADGTLNDSLTDAEKIFGIEKEILLNNTLPFLEELKQKQFILGFRK